MRVAFVTFEYPPFIVGGAGVYAARVTEELAKLGHQVVVFTPAIDRADSNKHPSSANLQVWHVPIRETTPFKALQFWIHLPKEIKKAENGQNFDIVHINGLSYWFLKRRLSPAPHVLTVHHLVGDAAENTGLDLFSRIKDLSGENGFFIPLIEKRAINSADQIIAVSNYTKDRILTIYHTPSEKIDVVYNGVDSDGCTFTQQDLAETKKQLGLSDLPVILFVGRVDDPRKGLDVLIRAFRKISDEIDATLLVVGKGDQTAARNLSGPIVDKIVFTGFVDDITLKKCYALCDVYVCPSRLEGFGLTLVEAMWYGKPIIASNAGAIKEVLRDYDMGVLVDSDNLIQLSNEILRFIEFGGKYNQQGENMVPIHFDWEKCAKQTVSHYWFVLRSHETA